MKKLIHSLYLFAAILTIPNGHLFAQTQNDSLQIKEAVVNYLEGLDTNNPDRVAKALHADLAKRIVDKNKEGKDFPSNMTAASLIGYTKDFDFTLFYIEGVDSEAPLKVDISIYEISNGIATVKAVTNKFEFVDYIHLGKLDGEWKIINILWAWTGNTNKWMNKE
ncbi:nuclear transport factor 2 family protein [Sabulilitoribacter multivorans]|uniref:Nuclear transport factor 2 family protein n=1 Tax=Flaviramulus multivorans TaxID=1304750 RepID=A0ABS9IKI4_9FLAO|nr:nuclear transport factor 2 family protein [Flaviramulus multivorans]MCF7561090.1 nuclear transport factor 2 family protein [Flaviramulus multivorans]